MKIYIKENSKKIGIPIYIPNSLLYSRFTQWIIQKSLENHTQEIDPQQINCLLREFKHCVNIHGHIELVNIQSKDGENISIRL